MVNKYFCSWLISKWFNQSLTFTFCHRSSVPAHWQRQAEQTISPATPTSQSSLQLPEQKFPSPRHVSIIVLGFMNFVRQQR
jgi:hypothetical protein